MGGALRAPRNGRRATGYGQENVSYASCPLPAARSALPVALQTSKRIPWASGSAREALMVLVCLRM